ncbi:hypothetical protein BO71DRAFT_153896 [Aspergillus ellipticus CBS 707.79]|uniref:Uncharacterized protein n=1 Tax=Aspergillus ellipticus CBS 707.79 TaxID=1448320 RepID=A0A319DS36_9EURO|nr:hypothetical protein BO71DRAFT_153896 [Aspergillus ellipticus CBS 707.79]
MTALYSVSYHGSVMGISTHLTGFGWHAQLHDGAIYDLSPSGLRKLHIDLRRLLNAWEEAYLCECDFHVAALFPPPRVTRLALHRRECGL